MARRFLKHPSCTESDDDAGCLSSWIGILDFGVGHFSQKVLSERKRKNRDPATGYLRKEVDFTNNLDIKPDEVSDGVEYSEGQDNLRMGSVKTLMEEDVSKTQNTNIQDNQLEISQSESGVVLHLMEGEKKKTEKCNVVPDHVINGLCCSSNLDCCQYNSATPTERASATYDLAAFMVELYHDNYHCKTETDSGIDSCPLSESFVHMEKIHHDEDSSPFSEKYLTLQKALDEIAKVFHDQKLEVSKGLVSNEAIKSREFIDQIEILSSNKEFLLKLIQNPNLPLLKHIKDIHDALGTSEILTESSISEQLDGGDSNEPLQNQKHHTFFRTKSKGTDSSQDVSRIVLLKPCPATIKNDSVTQSVSSSPLSHHSTKGQKGERRKSYFSLKGIKRRLRHVMGESRNKQHLISMDGLLDRIRYMLKDSDNTQKSFVLAGENSSDSQQIFQAFAVGEENENSKLTIDDYPGKESFIYEEGKKDLGVVIGSQDEKGGPQKVSRSLEKLFSVPEYDLLPLQDSSGNKKELVLSPLKLKASPSQQFDQESHMDHLILLKLSSDQDSETPVTDLDHGCIAQDLKTNELESDTKYMEIVNKSAIQSLEEHDRLEVLPEPICNEPGFICKEEDSSSLIEMETSVNKPQLVISSSVSPSFLCIEKIENPHDTLQKPEEPSPVSVFELSSLEEIIYPGSSEACHDYLSTQPQKSDFQEHVDLVVIPSSSYFDGKATPDFNEKEAMFVFVTTLLQVSGISGPSDLESQNTSEQILNPLLLEEVEFLHHLLPDDPNLLFDCINEVLAETQNRLLDCVSQNFPIKPSIQLVILRQVDLTEEVCRCIDSNLQLSECTFGFITMRDLEGRSWTNYLCGEFEAIVNEMADAILEEIMEETMSR